MSERPRQVLGHSTWGAHTHHPGTAVWLALRPLALAVSSQSLSSVHAPLVSVGGTLGWSPVTVDQDPHFRFQSVSSPYRPLSNYSHTGD